MNLLGQVDVEGFRHSLLNGFLFTLFNCRNNPDGLEKRNNHRNKGHDSVALFSLFCFKEHITIPFISLKIAFPSDYWSFIDLRRI